MTCLLAVLAQALSRSPPQALNHPHRPSLTPTSLIHPHRLPFHPHKHPSPLQAPSNYLSLLRVLPATWVGKAEKGKKVPR